MLVRTIKMESSHNCYRVVFALLFSHISLLVSGSDFETENLKSSITSESNVEKSEVRDSKSSNHTLFLAVNSMVVCTLLYFLVKMITSGSSKSSDRLRDALIAKQSEATKLASEEEAMAEELEKLEKELVEKEKEEEDMNFEKDELKIKMEDVMKQREKLAAECAKAETKLSEDVSTLEELKQKRITKEKQNKTLKDEFSQLKKNRKLLDEDVTKKDSELASPREVSLRRERDQKIDNRTSLMQNRDELLEGLEQLVKSLSELRLEKERCEVETREDLKRLDHFTEENKLLDVTLKRTRIFEENFDSLDGTKEGEEDNQKKKIEGFIDASLEVEKFKSVKAEAELLREVLESERGDTDLTQASVEKAKSELEHLTEEVKKEEKSSRSASIKLEVLKGLFEEKENELLTKLGKLEERDYEVLDDHQLSEKINQGLQLEHRYRTDMEVIQKDIQLTESGYKEKLNSLEKKAQDSWISSRRTDSNAKGLQQEMDALDAQLTEATEEFNDLNSKFAAKMPALPPQMMMPLSRLPMPPPPHLHMFPPPPGMFPPPHPPLLPPMFQLPDPEHHGNNSVSSMRSTPFSLLDRPHHGPSPAFRPLMENASTPSPVLGPRNARPPAQQQQQQQPRPPAQQQIQRQPRRLEEP